MLTPLCEKNLACVSSTVITRKQDVASWDPEPRRHTEQSVNNSLATQQLQCSAKSQSE